MESEIKERRAELTKQEKRLLQKEEVLAMSLTEFNAEEVYNDIRAEGIELGLEQVIELKKDISEKNC